MTGLEIWLLAIGLAMDCLAVSIASGIILRRIQWRPMLIMAFFFGLFQEEGEGGKDHARTENP